MTLAAGGKLFDSAEMDRDVEGFQESFRGMGQPRLIVEHVVQPGAQLRSVFAALVLPTEASHAQSPFVGDA